jgi:phosphatidylglycerol---prolipoprotein diacylglyceryl transferase
MLPVLQIGPLALQMPGLMYLIGLWLGLSLAEKRAAKFGISANHIYNLTFSGLIAGIVGARLGYVFQYPNAFLRSPLSLFSLNPGLLDPFFGAAAALIAVLIYGQRNKLPFWRILDGLTPVPAVFMIGMALAHIASGEAFGAETSLSWAIDLWGAKRHPSQFYELIGAIIILLALELRIKDSIAPVGMPFLTFVALSAGTRLFLEAFRGDSAVIFGGIRIMQVVAWLVLALALWRLAQMKNTNGFGNGFGNGKTGYAENESSAIEQMDK